MAQHLTDAIVKRLPAPAKGNKITYDDDVKGFGARVTAAGARAFVLNYRTKSGAGAPHHHRLLPDWPTTMARAEAKRLKQEIDRGGDPLGDIEAERAAPTVWELADRFEARAPAAQAAEHGRLLPQHAAPSRPAALRVAREGGGRLVRRHRPPAPQDHGHRPPASGQRGGGDARKMFSLAVRWDMRADNPAKGVERNYEVKRKRYMVGDELARLTAALAEHEDKQAANVIRVCLLSGCRVGEARSMRWADVDLAAGVWTKPGSTTKQRTDHVVPLSAPLRQLLADIRAEQAAAHPKRPLGEWVFPSGHGAAAGHRVTIKRDWRAIARPRASPACGCTTCATASPRSSRAAGTACR